ncbi:putative photosynthetic complex assembly protein PuhE [Salinisphaera sp. Q1T1-3]|uniref:putative photosynthetic complex assembly protein PuhE n=1 Tax=Salinisphaera sp. Q1T1-3 TaxID=2321229 RepID=UPI000E75C44D|nr:putative photosynthetic complex assembly protein PuhE [Salinisphaera sp. Q1T1-3]RJS92088.1 DUF3623 domain-containing protein [Salinisphaera sp. Q1T1-3]
MTEFALPLVYAVFVWWFATGCLFLLNALPKRGRRWSLAVATLVAVAAFVGLLQSGGDRGAFAAYLSFTCGLTLWGWQTMTYYMGFITGPRERACPRDAHGWARFGYGIAASLWHELAALLMGAVLLVSCWHMPNRIGLWTYLVLWAMHVSAKLNLFLGVRNTNDDFLPSHLAYLKSFFRKRRMNPLFPLSVTCGSLVTAACLDTALAVEADGFTTAGFLLVGTLSGLAVLEHACLFLPIPAALLWRWSHHGPRPGDGPAENTGVSTSNGSHTRRTPHKAVAAAPHSRGRC